MKPKIQPNLAELQRIWYDKLQKSGFQDIECADGSIETTTPWSVRSKKFGSFTSQLAIQEYYYMCTHFLNDYKFTSAKERIIWEYHSNGINVRDIAELLRKARFKRAKEKSTVAKIIKALEAEMYKLYWTSKK